MTCAQCEGIDRLFDTKRARRQLEKFRRKGADRTTRMLIEDVLAATQPRKDGVSSLLLDIGAGVGAIHHTLLDSGVERAVHVDASSAYLSAAREEAERRSHATRVEFVQGDFVDVADRVPDADIVTLDRVICCYHDMRQLVSKSSDKSRFVYGAVYPREGWWVRLSIAGSNVFFRVTRSLFRTFLHPPRDIESVLLAHGFQRRSVRRTVAWEVAVYTRSNPT
jgi:magnesium-protoporphyrin O-methyltransferase